MRKRQAFSLVEVIISLAVLTFGIVALFNIFPLAMNNVAYSRKLGEVALLAQKKIEALKTSGVVSAGITSGKEADLDWQLSVASVSVAEGITVRQAELEISFVFLGQPQKEKFITYLFES